MSEKNQVLKSRQGPWTDYYFKVTYRSSDNNIDTPSFNTSSDAFEFLNRVWDNDLQNLQE
jgi:hypothetical protein